MSFKDLGLPEFLLKAIEEKQFTNPSEIQTKTIPHVLQGKDIIAESATGSGKTLAFGVGIINKAKKNGGVQSIVLTPTRELAVQVAKELKTFATYKSLHITTIYGGVSINPQIEKLRSADIVVGTPGRVLDHLRRGTLDLFNISVVVLDEADRMLDMGFIDDVETILGQCPKKRQTLLFSATMPPEIQKLSMKHLKDPFKVTVGNRVDPTKLTQVYYDIPENQKFSLLTHLLKEDKKALSMVFCNTQRMTDAIANNLHRAGVGAAAIHGRLSQAQREITLDKFKTQHITVLVCTDVAARGLDIKGVSHVYNYDTPSESKQYIHRIGRTARAGKEGKAINLISQRDYQGFQRVLDSTKVNVTKMEIPEFKQVPFSLGSRSSSSGGHRQNRSGYGQRSGGQRGGDNRGRSSGGRSGRSYHRR